MKEKKNFKISYKKKRAFWGAFSSDTQESMPYYSSTILPKTGPLTSQNLSLSELEVSHIVFCYIVQWGKVVNLEVIIFCLGLHNIIGSLKNQGKKSNKCHIMLFNYMNEEIR